MSEERVPQVRVAVLGQVSVQGPGGSLVTVSGAAANLVGALALAPGHFLSVGGLAGEVWPDRLPARPKAALQTVVSRLRSASAVGLVRSTPGGYGFDLAGGAIDLRLASELLARARVELSAGNGAGAVHLCEAAACLWHGEPGTGIGNPGLAEEVGRAAASLHRETALIRSEALVTCGRASEALTIAEALARSEPLNDSVMLLLLRSLAGAGRVGDALVAYAGFRSRLVEELGADPAPKVARFHESLLRQADPLVVRRGPRRAGVRARADALVGRDRDLETVATLLAQARIVSVTGMGGVGKTRVAEGIATSLANGPHGVVVVPLRGARTARDVTRALAEALELPASQLDGSMVEKGVAPAATIELVASALAEDETVLILDDVEQALDGAAAWVEAITAWTERVRVLVTSRVALRVDGEHEYRLRPLSVDAGGDGAAAVDLFVRRAQARRPGMAIDMAAVRRLCVRLDGVPLAIELAAARCGAMPLAEIERGLDEGLGFLRTAERRVAAGQRSLVEVLNWSWALLSETQRRLCRRLALFPDGFDLRAASHLVPRVTRVDLLGDMDELVSLSLFRVQEDAFGGLRYRMYETVREFVTELGMDAQDARARSHGATQWAKDLAAELLGCLGGPAQVEALQRVRNEAANLRAILRTGLADDAASVAVTAGFALGVDALTRGDIAAIGRLVENLADAEMRVPHDLVDVELWWRIIAAGSSALMGRPELKTATMAALRRTYGNHPAPPPAAEVMAAMLLAMDGADVGAELAAAISSPSPRARRLGMLVAAFLADNTGDIADATRLASSAYEEAVIEQDVLTATFAAQILTGIHSQGVDGAATIAWARRAARGFAELGIDSATQLPARHAACAHLVAGDLDAAEAAFREYLAPAHPAADAALFGRSGLAEVAAARAEADGGASRARALAGYRAALIESPWSRHQGALWPMLFASSCLVTHAHAAAADDAELTILAERLRGFVVRLHREQPANTDGPLLGAIAGAFASWLAASGRDGRDAALAARLARLAVDLRARQDLPALNRARLEGLAPPTDLDAGIEGSPMGLLVEEVLGMLEDPAFPTITHRAR